MSIRFGRYQLLKKLASGGMGQVLLAKKGQGDFEKLVVLKRILPHLVEDEEFFSMFQDEAKIAMRLDHPNIARINEFGVEHGTHFIEMEYVAGEDLRRTERRAATLEMGFPLGVVLRIVSEAAAGLHFAHTAKDTQGKPLLVVHRDVSPQNILLGFDGSVKLIDFGVAKAVGRSQMTNTGFLKGKFPYMSPEQAAGGDLDSRSDIFSLGIVLWELLTGRRLFKGANDLASQRLVRACQVPRPSNVETSVPRGLDAIALKALKANPTERFQDADGLRAALEEFALEHGIPTSGAQLSAFMHSLYEERIAREADLSNLDEDSQLSGLDLIGLSIPPASPDRLAELEASPEGGRTPSQSAAEPSTVGPSNAWLYALGALSLLVIVTLGLWWLNAPPLPLDHEAPPPTDAPQQEPEQALAPLQIESEPPGATVELGDVLLGTTPVDIPRAQLPATLRLSAAGYESIDVPVAQNETGTKLISLRRKVTETRPPKAPDIKTTR